MLEIDLDGKKVSVPEGSMVMHAADRAGTYVPHFCYHKKLSIAANCRMCLVDVEKAPKPMPACATPVTQGMIVRTKSDKAIKAQQGVMEFLLINHPLDCPICDQGGECQLQDLAVGYGGSSSRYTEEKRVVFQKDVGPLISMAEMTRCIHCTRCVRFGQEVAGVMELGMIHRGEHSEITTIAGETIDSELSGNMIDICPVGALTSKPFRYSARTWELSRRKGVSPHDSTGANLIVQVKANRVMRVLPLENEEVNECWIADRDRFSYEALSSDDRLTQPMVKQGGQWQATDWTTALEYVARSLTAVREQHGAAAIGAVGSPHATVEELHLLARLVRGFGSENIDHRLRHADAGNAAPARRARWLGLPIAALSTLQRVLVVGSFLRKDHPLFAQRIRQAARRGAKVSSVHAVHDDWALPVAHKLTAAPSAWPHALAEIAAAVAAARNVAAPIAVQPGEGAKGIAASLIGGERKAILLGNAAAQHPQATTLLALAQWIGEHTGASVGYLGDAANSVGAQLVGAVPGPGGQTAMQMLSAGTLKALVTLHLEPMLDSADPVAAMASLGACDTVIALTAFRSAAADTADVMLPITPFTETAGTFVNAEGRAQSFHGVVKPLGDSRPAWKVLRVLGNLLGLPGFEFDSAEAVRAEALGDPTTLSERLDNRAGAVPASLPANAATGLERLSDVPIYATDPLVRRSPPLQATADARQPEIGLPQGLWDELALTAGAKVRVSQGHGHVFLPARLEASLATGVVRIAAGHSATAVLGAMYGNVEVTKRLTMAMLDTVHQFGGQWLGGFWPVVWTLVKIVAVVLPLMICVAYLTLWERKAIGWSQVRPGPNRVGPLGLLQPIADAVKLIFKEIILPSAANKGLFLLGPVMTIMPALAAWAVVPFGPELALADINAGLLFVMAITSMEVYGVIIAGWASNSKYAFLGALRASAQMVSYEIAMGFALVVVLMVSASLNLTDIVLGQDRGWFAEKGLNFLSWNWLPLLPICVVYVIAGIAETNRHPFDVVEGESEIVAGHMVEYSGMAFAMFFLAEYANIILVSTLAVVMFFGGWLPPVDAEWLNAIPGWIWLGLKTFVIATLFLWVRATFPRFRYDQIMRLGWKIFIPITLIWLVVVGLWIQSPWNIWK